MATPPPNRPVRLTIALVVVSLLFAGCHEPPAESDDGMTDGDMTEGDTTGANVTALAFQEVGDHGEILVDQDGNPLYVFTNDEPGTSNCYDQCATNWPPAYAGEVPSAPAVVAGDISLVDRTDGADQIAYKDQPLYYFIGDQGSGEANGDGRGGVWFIVRHPPANSEMLNDTGPHEVEQTEVDYHEGATGSFARPADADATTGVVMIHEWWGLNDNIRDMAGLLASHGYSVLAVDLFDGNVATTSQEAQAQVQALDQDEANANMAAAAAHLREQGATRIISLGWCFGGGQSLQLALTGEDLAATVIYYGFLVDDESRLSVIDHPVLGIFGEEDQAIPISAVRSFETALDNLSIDNQILIYPEVGHAFANPSGDSWAPEATADAWARTLRFLGENAGTP